MKYLILLILLVACGAQPSPLMFGSERRDVTVDGRDYTVFWTDHLVEVIRLGWASPGEHQGIRATMIDLVPQVTGCRISEQTLAGDSGEMHGRINCPRGR
jgi:hypothetical protein